MKTTSVRINPWRKSEQTDASSHSEWEEAFLRVASYLYAHHIESHILVNKLTATIIDEARARVVINPAEEPLAAAMTVTQAIIGDWFAQAGHQGVWNDPRVRVHARLALLLADVPTRGHDVFLSPEPVSAVLREALTTHILQPGPELRFKNMAPAVIDFGKDASETTISPNKNGWIMARAAAGWLLIMGLFGVAWAATH